MRRLDCHKRIKQVRRSYQTALKIVNICTEIAEKQPQHNLNIAEMRTLAKQLHDIYFVWMFACFESSLRNYWRTEIKDTKPLTEQLLSSLGVRRGVPEKKIEMVQKIRDFRNYLIHEEFEVTKRFTIDEAIGYLNTYLARLPLEW